MHHHTQKLKIFNPKMVFVFVRLKHSSSIIMMLLSLSLFIIFCTTKALVELPGNETVPALIVFGDSIVDPGNNNNLVSVAKCNYPPYGRDFPGELPTGRFSNGRIPSDLVGRVPPILLYSYVHAHIHTFSLTAQELGIKDLLPAYLDPTLQPSDLLTGVSFASGASGYYPLTPKISSVFSLSDQIELFKEYTGKLKAMVGEEATNSILSKSLFLVVQGSNDITTTYVNLLERQYDFASYADVVVTYASSFLKELYGLGARRVAVFSLPPLGCVPSQRTLAGGSQRACVEDYNQAAKLLNTKLSSELDSLSTNFPTAKFVYIDIYYPLLDLIQNPKKSGFEVVNKGCCGTGTIEVALLCNRVNPFTCTDVDKYVFWDSYHPTERAYKVLVGEMIQKALHKFL